MRTIKVLPEEANRISRDVRAISWQQERLEDLKKERLSFDLVTELNSQTRMAIGRVGGLYVAGYQNMYSATEPDGKLVGQITTYIGVKNGERPWTIVEDRMDAHSARRMTSAFFFGERIREDLIEALDEAYEISPEEKGFRPTRDQREIFNLPLGTRPQDYVLLERAFGKKN